MDGVGVRGGPRALYARTLLAVTYSLVIEMTMRGKRGYVGIVDDVGITM